MSECLFSERPYGMEYAKAQILCRWRKVNQLKKDISLGAGIAQLSTTLMGTGLFMVPAIAAGIAECILTLGMAAAVCCDLPDRLDLCAIR